MMFAEVLLDGTMIHVDCGGAFRLELPENLLKCTGCGKSMVIRPKPSCPAESAPRAGSAAQPQEAPPENGSKARSAACVGTWGVGFVRWQCHCPIGQLPNTARCPVCGDDRPWRP